MRFVCFVLISLILSSCTSSQEIILPNSPENFILIQTVETKFLRVPENSYNTSQALGGVYGTAGGFIGALIDESLRQNLSYHILQINYNSKVYDIDSILKRSIAQTVADVSNINVENEFSVAEYTSKWAKIGDKVIHVNYQYEFNEGMNSIQTTVNLKLRKVVRFVNRGIKRRILKYETYYEKQFIDISSILKNDGGIERIIAARKKIVDDWYEKELIRLKDLKSSHYGGGKKNALAELYNKKLNIIYSADRENYHRESLVQLWARDESFHVKRVFDNAAVRLSRMVKLDFSTSSQKRTSKTYKQLEPLAKRLGIIERNDDRVIVIDYLHNYCSLPLLANPRLCY